MTDLEARAEQLVEAMARAMEGEGLLGARLTAMAHAALNVVRTEREQITCPSCGGTGDTVQTVVGARELLPCRDCHGSGSVPGELLVVGLIGEQDQEPIPLVPDQSWLTRISGTGPARIIEKEAPQ